MNDFRKNGLVEKAVEVDDGELGLINRQSLKKLSAGEVFAFRLVACDTQVDRDWEHFTHEALEEMAKRYIGRPLLRDHNWSASAQIGRVYASAVEPVDDGERLVLRAYMVRSAGTEDTISAIEAGILREASVGVSCRSAVCDICGTDKARRFCKHTPGAVYDGKRCAVALGDVADTYEVSLVAVPSQRAAGVIKAYGGEENKPEPEKPPADEEKQKALALLELEKNRF
jgi:hypothetical protein